MASTASLVAAWIWVICAPISSVALPVWLARLLTSEATTAKPLPASPARAASMVAFRARRLVWLAMLVIRPTTAPIFSAASASARTMASVRLASSTALPVIFDDCATWRLISPIEADSSSVADATVSRPLLASSAAEATAAACAVALVRGACHGLCGGFQLRGTRRQHRDQTANLALESVRHSVQGRLLLVRRLMLGRFLCGPQTLGLDHAVLEHQYRSRHGLRSHRAGPPPGSRRKARRRPGGA